MPNNGDDGDTNTLKARQYQALGLLPVISFTAHPSQVAPFGTTTLSWEVKAPPSLHLPHVTLVIGGQEQGLSGSANFTVIRDTEFGLTAKTELVDRMIRSLLVTVDESVCKTGSISGDLIVNLLTGTLRQQFPGDHQVSLRSSGINVTLGDATISIVIPLALNIPNWFDAAMDISIEVVVGLGAGGTVLVRASKVDVHVDWTWVQDIAGCTEFGQKIAQAFMTEIVNNQLVPGIAQPLISQVQELASSAQMSDPQHRNFVLTSLTLTSDGITFTVCPR